VTVVMLTCVEGIVRVVFSDIYIAWRGKDLTLPVPVEMDLELLALPGGHNRFTLPSFERTASATDCPCETSTSTCRSFATTSSGLLSFLGILVLLPL
jgi:hypothetical protein